MKNLNKFQYDDRLTIIIDPTIDYLGEISPYIFKFHLLSKDASENNGYVLVYGHDLEIENDCFNMDLTDIDRIKNKCMEYVATQELELLVMYSYEAKEHLNSLGNEPSKELDQAVAEIERLKTAMNTLKDLLKEL